MKKVSKELAIGRFSIPYRAYGESGKVVVCVNGSQQTMSSWRSFVSAFVDEFTVVVFDFPAHGRAKTLSGPPPINIDEQIEVLLGVVKATNCHRINLACASWGSLLGVLLSAWRIC